ncbi:MAG: hypothetical protein ACOC2L_03840, partial [Candidatus Sumerlaeota bacterium]
MELREAQQHTFETILGQDLAKRFLVRACEQESLPHALMLTGPDGVGKQSLMFSFAKHMVSRHFEPESEAARKATGKVERGTHPDVMVVMPKTASGQILKSQVEEMHERAHFAPLEAPCKIILISPIEAMNVVAANDLLKLLEEPPPSLYILVCTEHIHQVLTTIRSRCALLRCPPVELETLAEWLTQVGRCSKRRAHTAAALSGGRPGLAFELLGGDNEERRRRLTGELELFNREGYASIFRVAHNLLLAGGNDPGETLELLITWYRDLMVAGLLGPQEADDLGLLVNRDLTD